MPMQKYGDLGGELLLQQKKSRKAVLEGDIFTYKLATGDYYFGRVISTKADQYHPTGEPFLLVYLYNSKSDNPKKVPRLDKNDLLIPPYLDIKNSWSRGFTHTVENRPLGIDDVHEKHFLYNAYYKVYNDGFGNVIELDRRTDKKLIGLDGLGSLASLDLDIREALGLKMPPWSERL